MGYALANYLILNFQTSSTQIFFILNETHASSNDILNLESYFCISNCIFNSFLVD